MISRLVIALLLTLPASAAFAAPYGMAGCGLGSIVFGDKPGIVQTFAATTNGTFGTQTFGITSGTSNCVQGGEMMPGAEAFMDINYDAIQKEAAEGKGEHLAALGVLLGCSEQSQPALFQTIQTRHGEIFTESKDADAALANVKSVVRTEPVLAQQCAQI